MIPMISWLSVIIGVYAVARLIDSIAGPNEKGGSKTSLASVLAIIIIVFSVVVIFDIAEKIAKDLTPVQQSQGTP